ncbi:methionyl-tRNA formyltransferase [Fontisphaera persica]|uniref:methionyl-tRNA formyltransferase n=1 Tax=Fontisphaera persica TaxID=2974023 RepID=UPI0024BF4D74|nr:methionyl-tRNA formyltransferase [Fontisphaera persica]WCJ60839.1 methionyl-tRNA formyltransferase [Fontisphaera persica]
MATPRFIFMGTAPLAAVSLRVLLQSDCGRVEAVVTQPDRPKGRDLKLQPSAVKEVALAAGLPVMQPEKARDPAFVEQLRGWRPDLIVVAAYGQLLPQSLLDIPPHGCLNVHASLLPRWRGAAPIQWAILAGDKETGVTIMKIDAGLDTGDMLTTVTTPILDSDNAQTLHDRLAQLGAELLVQTIPLYLAGQIRPRPQPAEGVTYARKLTKEDGRLDWRQSARELWLKVRALNPWPGAYAYLSEGGPMIKIWEAALEPAGGGVPGQIVSAGKQGLCVACGEAALRITALQKENGRRMDVGAFLAGHPLQAGQFLA